MSSNIEIKVFHDFESLEEEWNRMYKLGFPYSCSYDWCIEWWRYFSDGKELYIVAIYANQKLVLLAPMYKKKKTLFQIGVNPSLFDESGILMTETKYLKNLLAYVIGLKLHIEFNFLNLSSEYSHQIIKFMNQNSILRKDKIYGTKPYIHLADFVLKRKQKDEKKRLYNRISAKFDTPPSFDLYKGDIKEMIRMHKQRWGGGIFSKIEGMDSFIQSLVDSSIATLHVLSAGDTILAYHLGFVDSRNHFTSMIPVYNTNFRDLSLGKYMLFKMVEWVQLNKIEVFDFGRGSEDYKYWFASNDALLGNLHIYPNKSILNKIKKHI
ncbi:MAG: hypothetical protein KN64_09955 [Sulfurovum sp. AS07-7]|nr:MAG: hypothetical protein KN64_09955 [Sulfurovum sp. AS07-7]